MLWKETKTAETRKLEDWVCSSSHMQIQVLAGEEGAEIVLRSRQINGLFGIANDKTAITASQRKFKRQTTLSQCCTEAAVRNDQHHLISGKLCLSVLF